MNVSEFKKQLMEAADDGVTIEDMTPGQFGKFKQRLIAASDVLESLGDAVEMLLLTEEPVSIQTSRGTWTYTPAPDDGQ